jgi:hypothetical protein
MIIDYFDLNAVLFGFTDAVRTNSCIASATIRMVEDKIKSWLRQARDRDDGRKRRFLSAAAQQSTAKRIELDLPTDYDDSIVTAEQCRVI